MCFVSYSSSLILFGRRFFIFKMKKKTLKWIARIGLFITLEIWFETIFWESLFVFKFSIFSLMQNVWFWFLFSWVTLIALPIIIPLWYVAFEKTPKNELSNISKE